MKSKRTVEFVLGILVGVISVVLVLELTGFGRTASPSAEVRAPQQPAAMLATAQNVATTEGSWATIITPTATIVAQSSPIPVAIVEVQSTPTATPVPPTSTPVPVLVVNPSPTPWIAGPEITPVSPYPVPNYGYLRFLQDPKSYSGKGSPAVAGYAGKPFSVNFYAYLHDTLSLTLTPASYVGTYVYVQDTNMYDASVNIGPDGRGVLTATVPTNVSKGFHAVTVNLATYSGSYIGIFEIYVDTAMPGSMIDQQVRIALGNRIGLAAFPGSVIHISIDRVFNNGACDAPNFVGLPQSVVVSAPTCGDWPTREVTLTVMPDTEPGFYGATVSDGPNYLSGLTLQIFNNH